MLFVVADIFHGDLVARGVFAYLALELCGVVYGHAVDACYDVALLDAGLHRCRAVGDFGHVDTVIHCGHTLFLGKLRCKFQERYAEDGTLNRAVLLEVGHDFGYYRCGDGEGVTHV